MSIKNEYVYLVTHLKGDVENLDAEDADIDDLEGYKVIGIFSDEAHAEAAIARLRSEPGFSKYPNGFIIGPYALNEVYWSSGFFNPMEDEW